MRPQYVIKVYNSKYDISNIELAEVCDDQLGSFHPMRKMDIDNLSAIFGNVANGDVQVSPAGVGYELIQLSVVSGVVQRLSFKYISPDPVVIKVGEVNQKEVEVMLPPLLFDIKNGGSVRLYFIEQEKVGGELLCYNAFLPNVNSQGGLCMGTVDKPKLSGRINTADIMTKLVEGLTTNVFSHSSLPGLNEDEMIALLKNGEYRKSKHYQSQFKLTDHYEGKKNY